MSKLCASPRKIPRVKQVTGHPGSPLGGQGYGTREAVQLKAGALLLSLAFPRPTFWPASIPTPAMCTHCLYRLLHLPIAHTQAPMQSCWPWEANMRSCGASRPRWTTCTMQAAAAWTRRAAAARRVEGSRSWRALGRAWRQGPAAEGRQLHKLLWLHAFSTFVWAGGDPLCMPCMWAAAASEALVLTSQRHWRGSCGQSDSTCDLRLAGLCGPIPSTQWRDMTMVL